METLNPNPDVFYIEEDEYSGTYRIHASYVNRGDAIELANLLATAQSPFLRRYGLELERELMQVV